MSRQSLDPETYRRVLATHMVNADPADRRFSRHGNRADPWRWLPWLVATGLLALILLRYV